MWIAETSKFRCNFKKALTPLFMGGSGLSMSSLLEVENLYFSESYVHSRFCWCRGWDNSSLCSSSGAILVFYAITVAWWYFWPFMAKRWQVPDFLGGILLQGCRNEILKVEPTSFPNLFSGHQDSNRYTNGLLICTLIFENQGLEKLRSEKFQVLHTWIFFQFVTWIFFRFMV